MPHYDYKVIPAPAKGEKSKGVRTPEGRFAQAVETMLNRYGESGWEYVRAELLPNQERSGLTGSTTEWRSLLIFRRAREVVEDVLQPRLLDSPGTLPEDSPAARLAVSASRAANTDDSSAPEIRAADAPEEATDQNVVPYPVPPVDPDPEPSKER